jgi:beta-glucosidase
MKLKKTACCLAIALASSVTGCEHNDNGPATSADLDKEADQKAADLVAKMTLDEKIQQVHGVGMGVGPLGGAGYIPGISRLGIPDYYTVDSSSGINQFNAGENSALIGVENGATPLPSPIALAATWDTSVAYDYGKQIGVELRTLGFTEGLGGGVNLAREPRNGRTFEYLGEDPVLAGNMIAARIQGTQDQKVVATIKHFAANNQEVNRNTSNSTIDERTLRELYLLPFEIGVKEAKPGNVMCAYNLVNGQKSCENKYLLTDVLKTEWGYKGKVQSDWFTAVTDTVRAANAGLDEEEAGSTDDAVGAYGGYFPTFFNQKLKKAVEGGSVAQSRLDDMVQRRLRTVFRLGIMDSPAKAGGKIDQLAGDAAAQKVAEQSMVLLKNAVPSGASVSALPLNAASIKSIVVIGSHADLAVLSGGGSGGAPARNGNAVTCLDPTYAPGPGTNGCATWYKSSPLQAIIAKAPNASVTYLDGSDANAAATAAASADAAIVFATQWQLEGADLRNLSLPDHVADPANQAYDQNALISAVAAKAKRTIVVLESGTAVTMPWLDSVHSVLEAWYPGVQGGAALANVLFGDVNPSGKLPLTFPKSESDLPQKAISATDLNVVYSEGLKMGYRWYDSEQIEPLFAFGHGLSYTSFGYSGLGIKNDADNNITVSFKLSNDGKVAGAEVAQVYASLPSEVGDPPKRLIGWQKVQLAAGESKTVSITIKAERLAMWDVTSHKWKIAGGKYSFSVGGSSRDTKALTSSTSIVAK